MRKHKMIMQILGERMVHGAMTKRYNWPPVLYRLHNYGQEFKDDAKYYSQLKDAEALANSGIQVIQLKPCKETEEGKKYLDKKAAKK